MLRIGSSQLSRCVLGLSFVGLFVSACGGESDDGGSAGSAGTAGGGGSSSGAGGGTSGSAGSSAGGQGGQPEFGCEAIDCEPGSYCAPCLAPGGVIFACIPEGSVC